jgi:hypothetical protein
MRYTDPSGEKMKWWAWALIGLGADFLSGGLMSITATSTYFSLVATTTSAAGTAITIDHTVTYFGSMFRSDGSSWGGQRFNNSIRMIGGLFQTDQNKGFGANLGMLASRWSWELPQTLAGLGYSHIRNFSGNVDRVDYFGGATFATNENSDKRDGITMGNYINMNIRDEITGSFSDYVLNDPMFMHEYGHTIDSRKFGFSYLLVIGNLSLISAWTSKDVITKWKGKSVENPNRFERHDIFWTETRANRNAAKYFNDHFGINWEVLYPRYPLSNPF